MFFFSTVMLYDKMRQDPFKRIILVVIQIFIWKPIWTLLIMPQDGFWIPLTDFLHGCVCKQSLWISFELDLQWSPPFWRLNQCWCDGGYHWRTAKLMACWRLVNIVFSFCHYLQQMWWNIHHFTILYSDLKIFEQIR